MKNVFISQIQKKWREMSKPAIIYLHVFLMGLFLLVACSVEPAQPVETGKLKVIATTTIVGDVVRQVGGDLIELGVLLPVGTDPHSFDPTPQDVARVADADVVIANGVGLEEFLDPLIESAGAEAQVVYVSEGIDFLVSAGDEQDQDLEREEHYAESLDPHTWTDPNNVIVWVQNVERILNELDPDNTNAYTENAEQYIDVLRALDAWIRDQVVQIPEANRKLVSDHAIFGYYAEEYGLEQVGVLVPGYSTLSEPSAKDIAAIEDVIAELGVKAVFVGNTVNPSLGERVAEDTGTELVFVYTGSLSNPGGEADSYRAYMRFNTEAFVDALR